MPHTNAVAIGGEAGAFLPQADGMTNGLNVAGTFEHYITARDSLRAAVEVAQPRRDVETSDSVRQIRVGADIVHNWEGGAVHPFVGAGLGAYFLQPRDNGRSVGDSATKLGGSVLGGLEVPIWWRVGAALEYQHRWVPDALGTSGVSREFNETDLGGGTFRIRIMVSF